MTGEAHLPFDGKVAVITGSTMGIGLAIAQELTSKGARVVVNGRDPDRGRKAVESLTHPDRASFLSSDITTSAGVDALFDFAVERHGQVDVAVLNAGGVEQPAPIVDMTDEEWDLEIAWILSHVFWGIRRAMRLMVPRGAGRIIAISSKQGKVARAGAAGYAAAKHGVNGLVKAAAIEAGPHGITVNALCPGSVLTDMKVVRGTIAAEMRGITLDELLAGQKEEAAIKRLVTPEEVASLCAYVASDAAGAITGALLNVDGGVAPY
ncbi:MAG: SDR family NAD(P)-dependent oxidoreductase [Acidimicrobiia bacterium]